MGAEECGEIEAATLAGDGLEALHAAQLRAATRFALLVAADAHPRAF